MLKKIALLVAFAGSWTWASDTITPRIGIDVPAIGTPAPTYATKINNAFSILDSSVAVLTSSNVYTSSNTFNASIINPTISPGSCITVDANGKEIGQSCGSGGGGSSSLGTFVGTTQISSPTARMTFSANTFRGTLVGGATAQIDLLPTTTYFIQNTASAQAATFNVSSGTANNLNTSTLTVINSATIPNATISGPILAYSSGTFLNSVAIGTTNVNGQPFRIIDTNGSGIASLEASDQTPLHWNLKNNTAGSSPNLDLAILGTGGDSATGGISGDGLVRAANALYLVAGGASSNKGIAISTNGVSTMYVADGSSITNSASVAKSRINLSLPNSSRGGLRINSLIGGGSLNEYVDMDADHITLNQQVFGPAGFTHLDFCNAGTCQSIYGDPTYASPPNGLYFLSAPNVGSPPLFVGTSSVTVNAGGFNSNYGIKSSTLTVNGNVTVGGQIVGMTSATISGEINASSLTITAAGETTPAIIRSNVKPFLWLDENQTNAPQGEIDFTTLGTTNTYLKVDSGGFHIGGSTQVVRSASLLTDRIFVNAGSTPAIYFDPNASGMTLSPGLLAVVGGISAASMTVADLTSGQCVQAGSGGRLSTTGAACSAGGGGSSVYPATSTASFPFGFSASSVTFSSNTIMPGATFYQAAPAVMDQLIVSTLTLAKGSGINFPRIVSSTNTMTFENQTENGHGTFNFMNADNTEVRLTGGSPSNTNGFYIFTDTGLVNGGIGVDASGSSSLGRFQFSPDGFTTNVTLGCDILGCAMGTVGVAAYFQYDSVTLATLQSKTPGALFQSYGCSDCVNAITCISTGTVRGAFASMQATNRTTACN